VRKLKRLRAGTALALSLRTMTRNGRRSHIAQPAQSLVFYEILGYLLVHPKAQDTVEGIVTWWLMTQRITQQTAKVKAALAELVAGGLVLERRGPDGRLRYRINSSKIKEVRRQLANHEK